jgi:hypothetical protein
MNSRTIDFNVDRKLSPIHGRALAESERVLDFARDKWSFFQGRVLAWNVSFWGVCGVARSPPEVVNAIPGRRDCLRRSPS